MPLGIVSDDDFESELENSSVDLGEIRKIEKPGRREGDVEVPNSLRKIIGETSQIEGRGEALELANNFGISPSSVSAYSHGATSTASYDKQVNQTHIDEAKARISQRARKRLYKAISCMTDDKFENCKVADLGFTARALSAVIKDMDPPPPKEEDDKRGMKGPTFIIYSPQVRDESKFDVIQVKE